MSLVSTITAVTRSHHDELTLSHHISGLNDRGTSLGSSVESISDYDEDELVRNW